MYDSRNTLLETISGRLVVSVQAGAGHALRDPATIARIARAAVDGGAAAIRCGGVGGLDDIAAVRSAVPVPVIGLTKEGSTGVYITPRLESVRAVCALGAEIVALDGTTRPRPDGSTLAEAIAEARDRGAIAMADCATVADGTAAAAAGAAIIGTTLSGYTDDTADRSDGPDLDLLAALRRELPDRFLVGEGRYHSPDDVRRAFDLGADAVVVGTALTDITWATARFVRAIPSEGSQRRTP